jgi:WD40 repeat protein
MIRVTASFAALMVASLIVALSGGGTVQAEPTAEQTARVTATEQAYEAVVAKQTAAKQTLTEIQNKGKTVAQQLAKAKAEDAKAKADLAAAEKALTEKVAATAKAVEDAKAPEKAYQDSVAAVTTAQAAKAAAEKVQVDSAAVAKAAVDAATTVKALADKVPGDKQIQDLKALADKVVTDTAAVAKDAVTKTEAAVKVVTDAETASKAAQEKLTAAQKVVTDAQAAQKAAEDAVAAAKVKVGEATTAIQASDAAFAAVKAEQDGANGTLLALGKDANSALAIHQEALAAAGQFVSFSKQIAPIFAKKCVACHNAQMAKGRYNMDGFALTLKGGERGPAVTHKNPAESELFTVIESGEMPQDADPLPPEEQALIKQWIATGARLDAGLKPDVALSQIMPKLPQPSAPETYRVPVPVTAVGFNPDGSLLASSGYHEVNLWNPNDGALVRRISNVAERVYDVEFSPTGASLAVAAGTPGQMGEVKLFNPADGSLIRDLVTSNDAIFAVAFSPDGRRLATAGADRTIRIFNLENFSQDVLIEDHADWVMGIAFSPDGAKLASAARDKTSKLFDAKTGDSLLTFPTHNEVVYGVAFSPDGTQVLTSGRDNRIRVWNPTNAQQIREIGGFGGEVYRVVVTADGRVFSCSADKQAREHKAADGAAVRAFAGHTDWVYSVAFNPATKKLASGSWDGEIRVWNAEDAKGLVNFVAAPGFKPAPQTAAK